MSDGKRIIAKKEVILSTGAYRTPQLLMLSGMGPTPILNKFKIPVYINNLEFGRNIHDHRRHCQASYGIFGQILISLMPRHTIFLFFSPSQSNIYNMCKSDLSSRPLQLHVSSASSTSNFLEHDLFNRHCALTIFDISPFEQILCEVEFLHNSAQSHPLCDLCDYL